VQKGDENMKITTKQIKQMIKEELQNLYEGYWDYDDSSEEESSEEEAPADHGSRFDNINIEFDDWYDENEDGSIIWSFWINGVEVDWNDYYGDYRHVKSMLTLRLAEVLGKDIEKAYLENDEQIEMLLEPITEEFLADDKKFQERFPEAVDYLRKRR